jgi:hypothetical protein
MTTRQPKEPGNDVVISGSEGQIRTTAPDNVAGQLTFTVDGPEVIDLRADSEIAAVGPLITPEQALAVRPRLDDPTRLTNGNLHPRYAEWIVSRTWAEQHPLSEYLTKPKHVDLLTDERGYFDRKRVNRLLGPSGSKYWLVDGPLPTKTKLPLLAELLAAPVEEVEAVVEEERLTREQYRSVVDHCRWMPYKLLSYEQVMAGVPCPGCGRPWVGPQDDIDTDVERWRALHDGCHAGRNGYTSAPVHCMRCCGVPPPSPAQLEAIALILQSAIDRREREEQVERSKSPEVRRQQEEQAAMKRAKRIEKLEAELVRLRDEEAEASRRRS